MHNAASGDVSTADVAVLAGPGSPAWPEQHGDLTPDDIQFSMHVDGTAVELVCVGLGSAVTVQIHGRCRQSPGG